MMTVSAFLVDFLISKGVTDVFGIPGGVVLDFLYALDSRDEVTVHLSYHEQCAAFEACGYSQFEHNLGVVYATRGPGFTNLITAIADAYSDSVPVMFITAHSLKPAVSSLRFEADQELDTISMVENITKYAVKLENIDQVKEDVKKAYFLAMSGRKGPVLLDVASDIWNCELPDDNLPRHSKTEYAKTEVSAENLIRMIEDSLQTAKRPLLLVGDGIRQSNTVDDMLKVAETLKLPVISSRGSQDVASKCSNYYGYLGSHGIRYSNFIFVKADLVLSLGNRLSFPADSISFSNAMKNKKIIRVDIDTLELSRHIPNSVPFEMDLRILLPQIVLSGMKGKDTSEWLCICQQLKRMLIDYDINRTVKYLYEIFMTIDNKYIIVSDVGNNEFWTSRAYELAGISNRILYSKSFGSLGCAIGKAIGAFYACRRPVICVVGDQGFQMNLQELQFLAQEQLPIAIVLINNHSSGMIRDREKQRYGMYFVHTTFDSGYSAPDFSKIAKSYGINYYRMKENSKKIKESLQGFRHPFLIEIILDENTDLEPGLPKGYPCQRLVPELSEDIYLQLNSL